MIEFGFQDFKTKFPNWSKHHKTLGLHVKRVYKDGKEINPKDESLQKLIEQHKDILKPKHVDLFDRKTYERKQATDYYLPLINLEYEDASDLDYYSVGAMNTRQTTHVRFKFLLDYDRFILDYSFKGSGSYALSFKGLLDSMDFVEDAIEEVLDQRKPLEEVGITKGVEGGYHIVLVTPEGSILDAEVEKGDLIESLVGVEVYRFDHEIVN